MPRIWQIGQWMGYFLIGLLGCYSFSVAIARQDEFFEAMFSAGLAATVVAVVGGLIAGWRSALPLTGKFQHRLKAGGSWVAGAIGGGGMLPFLVVTPFLAKTAHGDSRVSRIIQKIILVCLPNDRGCASQQYYGTIALVIFFYLFVGFVGAIVCGELARRRYVDRFQPIDMAD
jgi:hypothetical protein